MAAEDQGSQAHRVSKRQTRKRGTSRSILAIDVVAVLPRTLHDRGEGVLLGWAHRRAQATAMGIFKYVVVYKQVRGAFIGIEPSKCHQLPSAHRACSKSSKIILPVRGRFYVSSQTVGLQPKIEETRKKR